MIIAICEHCHGIWRVRRDRNPMTLEGGCRDCLQESDAEHPLTFGLLFGDIDYDELPEGWLAE